MKIKLCLSLLFLLWGCAAPVATTPSTPTAQPEATTAPEPTPTETPVAASTQEDSGELGEPITEEPENDANKEQAIAINIEILKKTGSCQKCYLERAQLQNLNLGNVVVDLQDADLDGAVFTGATLNNALFHGAKLRYSHFNNADLEGASFDGADLSNANFSGAKGDFSTAGGAILSATTLPDGTKTSTIMQ